MTNGSELADDFTLRDFFAGLAMQGILANPNTMQNTPYYVAEDAYKAADAMLDLRERKE